MREELLGFISPENLTVEPKACLNHLNRGQVCRACVDSCPTDAIQLDKNMPLINYSSCINCGACISNCPTLAIDHNRKPYAEISKQVREYPDSNITCDQLENYQKGVKVPCYLYLDVPLILLYSNGKNTVSLYTGKCETCSKAGNATVEEHINKLQRELNQFQIPITIQLHNTELDDTKDQTVNGLTRRELLQKFSVKNIREMLSQKEEVVRKEEEREKLTVKERVIFKRDVLNKFYEKYQISTNQELLPFDQFFSIEVLDNCSGCNVCESICPTNAIRWLSNQNESRLIFSLQECIACKKCVVCPEKSIRFSPVTLDEYLTSQRPKQLKSFQLKICKECGESFRTNKEVEICTVCEVRKGKDPKRFFSHYLK